MASLAPSSCSSAIGSEHSEQLNCALSRFAYSAEDDRLFRRNVTGYSAGSALVGFSTLVGHDQSRFHSFL